MTAQDKIDSVASRAGAGRNALALAVRDAVPQIARRLPAFLGQPQAVAERYAAIAVGMLSDNPYLSTCTPASIVRGVIRAAEYGLALDGVLGHAYLVPYNVKGVKVAQFQLGYRGLVELMYRTGQWASISAEVVREGDALSYSLGTNPFLNHVPPLVGRGERIGVYAVAHPTGGGVPTFVLLARDAVETHRAASKAWQNNPKDSIWEKYPDVAWRKSAIRELSKSVSMATERHSLVRQAAVVDERIDAGDPTIVDAEVDDEPPPGQAVDMEKGGPA